MKQIPRLVFHQHYAKYREQDFEDTLQEMQREDPELVALIDELDADEPQGVPHFMAGVVALWGAMRQIELGVEDLPPAEETE